MTEQVLAGQVSRTSKSGAPGGTYWRWWNDVVLRGAGFPAGRVLELASPPLAAAADALGRSPQPSEWDAFAATFATEVASIAERLQHISREPHFEEALAWQNYRVFETAIEPLLRWRRGLDNRHRKQRAHEHLVASYWQRYCVKNDSIGFFGPIGWARLEPQVDDTRLQPGRMLLDRCSVRFESWAIDALAEELGRDAALRRWVPPRRIPYIGLRGADLIVPNERPVRLAPAEASALRKCDGRLPAWRIAEAVVGEAVGCSFEDEALALLEEFAARRWILWKLDVPVGPQPELALRRALASIGDEQIRQSALAKLDELVAARDEVVAAGRDGARVRHGLSDLEARFRSLTHVPGVRNEGKTYAARTILYKDCRRNVSLVLGADFVRALEPVELLLESARWLTHETGRLVRKSLLDVLHACERRVGEPVPLSSFWFECMPILHGSGAQLVDGIERDFQRRWAAILACRPEERRVERSLTELRDVVTAAFAAPGSGWSAARYYSPDVMLAASRVDDLGTGRFRLVVGEFHLAINTLRHTCFVQLHPAPERLFEALDRDFPLPRLLPILPKESPPRLTARLHPALDRERDFLVGLIHTSVPADRPRVVASADVRVADQDGDLVATLPSGMSFDILDVFSEALMGLVYDRFRLFGDIEHAPRMTIDKVIAARESWSFEAGSLAFATEKDEAKTFVHARSWARDIGLPRHVFVKSALEQKPFYVDFMSPVSVSVLAKAIRRAASTGREGCGARIRVVEMLPTPDETWLIDANGARYTSELRLVAFDLCGSIGYQART